MKDYSRRKGDAALRLKVYSLIMNNEKEFGLDEQDAMKMSYYVSSTFIGLTENDNEIKTYVKLALEAIENDNKFKECISKFDDTTPISEIKEYQKEYYQKRKERWKKSYKTNEWKIYNRVNAFNRRHKDKIVETALEAKRKYLESGYIPTYIKNNDIIK